MVTQTATLIPRNEADRKVINFFIHLSEIVGKCPNAGKWKI